ncbi:MAG TPA: ArsR family transcriptional regulator [Gemmatimonadaceae bacterium]|nr:ArsR family transcriptional regulator [Gemmatimonadaceae bacterium]
MPRPPDPALPASAARLAVLEAVRRGNRTVNALAAELGVTDNAVRLHLAALERDRLIERLGTLHSGRAGQPAAEYELTTAGELALSRAYPPAFTALVGALASRLEPRALRALFADAGRRLATETGSEPVGTMAQRADACAALLDSLGGSTAVSHSRRGALITGTGCPLAAAVRVEPATCILVEALLARHAGVKATQECEHGDHPRCRFRIM